MCSIWLKSMYSVDMTRFCAHDYRAERWLDGSGLVAPRVVAMVCSPIQGDPSKATMSQDSEVLSTV
jgi:hypothetical protein